jgi:uncharacterized protein YebE (UPF0316 family)
MEALLIMAIVLVEVALWQWRVAITIRGRVTGGVVLGFVGAILQVTAISRVVQDMGDIARVAAYAAGVGLGVLLGCVIDRRVRTGHVSVRVFAPVDGHLVPALRGRGWPVTATDGEGHDGPVVVLFLAIDERRTPQLEDELRSLAPGACWTVERIAASRGLLGVTST